MPFLPRLPRPPWRRRAEPETDSGWRPTYAPRPNGTADPGEVVWAWVPFEEDPHEGKDRPVLVLGLDRGLLVALPLTSKDHDRYADAEARAGRHWMDIGSGPWDRERRPSEVRLDRVLRIDPRKVRREGAAVPREVFDAVVEAATPYL